MSVQFVKVLRNITLGDLGLYKIKKGVIDLI